MEAENNNAKDSTRKDARKSGRFFISKFQTRFLIYSQILATTPILMVVLVSRYASDLNGYASEAVVFVVSLITLLVLFVGGLLLSNRIAGPLMRIERHLNDFAEGKTSGPVQLREGDLFQELAEAVNRALRKT